MCKLVLRGYRGVVSSIISKLCVSRNCRIAATMNYGCVSYFHQHSLGLLDRRTVQSPLRIVAVSVNAPAAFPETTWAGYRRLRSYLSILLAENPVPGLQRVGARYVVLDDSINVCQFSNAPVVNLCPIVIL